MHLRGSNRRLVFVICLAALASMLAVGVAVAAGPGPADGVKFVGTVQTLPPGPGLTGDWTVSAVMAMNPISVTVHVSTTTEISPTNATVAVGTQVKIEGIRQPDNSINAMRIQVLAPPKPAGTPIVYLGVIKALPAGGLIGDWTVNERTVHVTSTTSINQARAKAEVDAFVQVEGKVQQDGSVNAQAIQVRASPMSKPAPVYVKIYGVVQSDPAVPGTWLVNTFNVNVTATTKIVGGTAVKGSRVNVKGTLQQDGSVNAVQIEVLGKMIDKAGGSTFGRATAFAHTSE